MAYIRELVKKIRFPNKVFLPALVNPTAPRAIGAATIAPAPTTSATPAVFRTRFPKTIINKYNFAVCNKEDFFLSCFLFLEIYYVLLKPIGKIAF